MSRVIVRAYIETGALERPCPTCGAQPAEWCRTDHRTPCVKRCRDNAPPGGSQDRSEGSVPHSESQPPLRESPTGTSGFIPTTRVATSAANDWHDPSEPRHPREDEE